METPTLPPPAEPETMLMFGQHPVRIIIFEDGGTPWFSLEDVCEAAGWNPFVAQKANNRHFPAHGKRVAIEDGPDGSKEVTVLSPVGVWFLTELVDSKRGEKIAAWARREASRLCQSPLPGDPAMFLTLMDDRTLPPRPTKYSGRLGEWRDLKDTADYITPHMAAMAEAHARDMEIMDRIVAARVEATRK